MILENGDRQLFFQDSNGSIRRAIRTANNQWNTSLHLKVGTILPSNVNLSLPSEDNLQTPKRNTPLAVTVSNFLGDYEVLIKSTKFDVFAHAEFYLDYCILRFSKRYSNFSRLGSWRKLDFWTFRTILR